MSFASEERDVTESHAAPPSIEWRSWPLVQSLPAAVMVLIGLAATGAAVHWVTGRLHLALLAVAALGIALWRFFLPTTFELNSEGVSQWRFGRRRRIPWREIRRYDVYPSGVLLLPVADACPLDACGGLFLPWGKHRPEVLAHVHYYLDRPAEK